jgi:hypothetical protein
MERRSEPGDRVKGRDHLIRASSKSPYLLVPTFIRLGKFFLRGVGMNKVPPTFDSLVRLTSGRNVPRLFLGPVILSELTWLLRLRL